MGKLSASDAMGDDWFGQSVGISEAITVIGSYGANGGGTDLGAAYVLNLQPFRVSMAPTRNDS